MHHTTWPLRLQSSCPPLQQAFSLLKAPAAETPHLHGGGMLR